MYQTQQQKVLIGGGSGFVGRFLKRYLERQGFKVLILSRSVQRGDLTWQQLKEHGLPECYAVINLAGKHILDLRRRWNEAYKNEVLNSRIETTRLLVDAINNSAKPPAVFISASGKCFYGTSNSKSFVETAGPGQDFPGQLCHQWETAASCIDASKIRHVHIRLGIVLGPMKDKLSNTGIVPLLRLPFLFGLGARFGTGKQFFPWVHIDDVCSLFVKAMLDHDMQGVYNAVSPNIVSQKIFMQQFAKTLHRPVLFRIPESLVRFVVSEDRMPILTQGQHVVPDRTLQSGFKFNHAHLDDALENLLHYHNTTEEKYNDCYDQ
jgi:uncharacterized protein (TIGR01777 family)